VLALLAVLSAAALSLLVLRFAFDPRALSFVGFAFPHASKTGAACLFALFCARAALSAGR